MPLTAVISKAVYAGCLAQTIRLERPRDPHINQTGFFSPRSRLRYRALAGLTIDWDKRRPVITKSIERQNRKGRTGLSAAHRKPVFCQFNGR